MKRARELTRLNAITDGLISSVQPKYCNDADQLQFIIDMGLIDDVLQYWKFYDDRLGSNLESEVMEN